MIIPRHLSSDEQSKFKTQIKYWHGILESIVSILNDFSPEIATIKQDSAKDLAAFKLWLTIDSTFRSIAILNHTGHFSDSYSILRILFESHLHLWNIINGDEEQSLRFLNLSIIQNWRVTQEITNYSDIPEIQNYINNVEDLKRKYEEALSSFGSKPGKIPRNYTTLSNKKIALLIEEEEKNVEPSKYFMFLCLYSSGSEYIHHSYIRISEGFTSVDVKHGNKTSIVLIPSPTRGIETAWWASLIILDSIKWTSEAFQLNIKVDFDGIRNRIANLAYYWQNGELR